MMRNTNHSILPLNIFQWVNRPSCQLIIRKEFPRFIFVSFSFSQCICRECMKWNSCLSRWELWRLLSPGTWHRVVRQIFAISLEELANSLSWAEEYCSISQCSNWMTVFQESWFNITSCCSDIIQILECHWFASLNVSHFRFSKSLLNSPYFRST